MWFTLMDAGDAQTCFKPEREWTVGCFFWWLEAAGLQPELSVARLCCFAAFSHKGNDACFLIGWDLVLPLKNKFLITHNILYCLIDFFLVLFQ